MTERKAQHLLWRCTESGPGEPFTPPGGPVTVIVGGGLPSDTIVAALEASNDGTYWATIATFGGESVGPVVVQDPFLMFRGRIIAAGGGTISMSLCYLE